MERRLFLSTLFKGLAIPIVTQNVSVFIDSTKLFNPLTANDILELELDKMRYAVTELFDKDSFFYGAIGGGKTYSLVTLPMRIPLQIRPGGKF